MKNFIAKCGLAAMMLAALISQTVPALAALTITPTLVVIEGRQRYADVNLVNTGNEISNYEISWRFYRMEDGTGRYLNSETSTTEFDLSKHMIVSPKRIQIDAKTPQRIRLGLRLNGEPPAPGDYRAHLSMRELPAQATGRSGAKGTRLGVSVNVGFTIPVIYRVGTSDATVTIGKVGTAINKKTGRIEMSVEAVKSKSPYGIMGRVEIYYRGDLVGKVANANIFPEASKRIYKIPLNTDKLEGGDVRIVYKSYEKTKPEILTEKTIAVGG